MIRSCLIALGSIAAAGLVAPPVHSAPYDNQPKLYLHAVPAPGPTCASLGLSSCQEATTTADTDGAGFDVLSWTACAPHQFQGTNWPKPGTGNILSWNTDCRTEATAVAGCFYCGAYSTDVLQVTPSPNDGLLEMARCNQTSVYLGLDDLGFVVATPGATAAGCNPCVGPCPEEPVPVQAATWSGVKALSRPR
jgi:hypothetical protein